MLDLERCPFIRPLQAGREPGAEPSADLGCWAEATPRELDPGEQRERCFTVAHSRCRSLLAAIGPITPDDWSEVAAAAQVVAESCYLAQARLEVQAERLRPAVARLFGRGG